MSERSAAFQRKLDVMYVTPTLELMKKYAIPILSAIERERATEQHAKRAKCAECDARLARAGRTRHQIRIMQGMLACCLLVVFSYGHFF